MNYTQETNWLQANLTKERYEHSLGTAECAMKLAQRFNLNEEKAYYAGLIHDCAKCLSKEESLKIMANCELIDGEKENPKTWHAVCAPYIAKKEFNIDDEEILSSIRWHTLGKINMTNFEKIIFIADKIEERTRPVEFYLPIKKALDNGLDSALLICYQNTIKSLVERNLGICTLTVDIYNDLLLKSKL